MSSIFPDLSLVSEIAFDLETRDPNLLTKGSGATRDDGYAIGAALAWREGNQLVSLYLPWRHEGGGNLDPGQVRRYLNEALGGPQPKVFANAAYDLDWGRHFGVKVNGPKYDIQIADPLLNENHKSYRLDALAERHLGQHKLTDSLVELAVRKLGVKKDKVMGEIWRLPADDVSGYAKGDAELTLQVWNKQKPLLEAARLWDVFEMETSLVDMLFDMRWYGVAFDVDAARTLQVELAEEESEQGRIIAGLGITQDIDLWSAVSIASAASSIGLEVPRNERGVPLVAAPWLKVQDHPFFKCILAMRRANRAGSSAVQNLIDFTYKGRIHSHFWQARHDRGGTRSGRLSSSNPNLQQVHSRDGAMKPRMRGLFKPDEGCQWMSADFSQAEPRITVHYAAKMGLPGAAEALRAYVENPDQDYHQLVSDRIDWSKVHGVAPEARRYFAKQTNLGLCLAEGQMVLTDQGLIPIENVTKELCVWDGIEWVRHEGLVCSGTKEVITYDGVTATPEHEVYTRNGPLPIRVAASRLVPILRSGVGGTPVRILGGDINRSEASEETPFDTMPMSVRQGVLGIQGESGGRKVTGMPFVYESEVLSSSVRKTWSKIRRDCFALREFIESQLSQLWWAWHREPISSQGSIHSICAGELASRGLQTGGHRPDKQRWTLRAGEHQTGNSLRESSQQKTFSKVYDLVNAGPRHRFTVEGKLVSNSYGMGVEKLGNELGLSKEDAQQFINEYHEGVPFVRRLGNEVKKVVNTRGYVKTILGRRRNFDLFGPVRWTDGIVPKPFDEARAEWKHVVRYFTHKALNALIQGAASDVMKMAMLRVYEAGLLPHLTIHDELCFSLPLGKTGRVQAEAIKNIMEHAVKLLVPHKVEVKIGPDWGHLEDVK